jgi:predicted SnoaL-like aldol condensation-catalyzing enzyme
MPTTQIDKVSSLFAGINAGNTALATQSLNHMNFVQHDPLVADGVIGLINAISRPSPDRVQFSVVRILEDGAYVMTHSKAGTPDHRVFFDVFRFDGGLIVEHWGFSAGDAPPNESGHTQIDGPIGATHLEDTEKNKAFARRYYETFHIGGDHSQSEPFFTGDVMIRHEPGVRDGLSNFMHDVEELMKHRSIDEIKLLVGEGDLVFLAAKGTHEDKPCLYVDLYRVEDEKIVEHWGFPQMVPPPAEWKNNNGML